VIEREVKMGAWAGFALPDLDGIVEGVRAEARPARTLSAVYYDTADLRLARWGVSLRHRAGDGTGWTVKLPEGDDGPALVRRELTFEGRPGAIPAEATALVTAYARGARLEAVARMRTVRTGVNLLDAEGTRVAEVVDDEVSVLHGGRVAARFREVEAEIGDRAPEDLLDRVVATLRQAGAGEPDPTTKVVRALGPRALGPPEIVLGDFGCKPTVAAVVRNTLATSVVRILRHDAGIRIGDDPEDVHQARVGTRRLRSDLRTFGPMLDEAWLARLRLELKWLADLLGAVRDADVLLARLRAQTAAVVEPDSAGLAPLLRQLAKQREDARLALLDAMTGPRYVELLDALVDAARAPRCRAEADRSAAKVVPDLVRRPWKRLRGAVRALSDDPPAADLHRIRILAKRARYAADGAAPTAGKEARSFAAALADLQGVLGEHQDAVVAEAWLRSSLTGAGPAVTLAGADLIAMEQADAAACRARWRQAWKRASGKKLRSWL